MARLRHGARERLHHQSRMKSNYLTLPRGASPDDYPTALLSDMDQRGAPIGRFWRYAYHVHRQPRPISVCKLTYTLWKHDALIAIAHCPTGEHIRIDVIRGAGLTLSERKYVRELSAWAHFFGKNRVDPRQWTGEKRMSMRWLSRESLAEKLAPWLQAYVLPAL